MGRKETEFVITKAQVAMMVAIYKGEKEITMFSHRPTLELRFIDAVSKTEQNRNVILELVRKQLIQYDYKFFGYNLTKLGNKITRIKLKRKETNALTVVKPDIMVGSTRAAEIKRVLKTYNFLKA